MSTVTLRFVRCRLFLQTRTTQWYFFVLCDFPYFSNCCCQAGVLGLVSFCCDLQSRSALVFSVGYISLLCLPCRASFSVQVRDFIDLVVTRLSDLNGLGGVQRRREGGEGRQRTRVGEGPCNRDSALAGRDCGNPTTREARTSLPLQIDYVSTLG